MMKININRNNRLCLLFLAAMLCLRIFSAGASDFKTELHSNGLGGGRWSDPATWHGQKVPVESDHAIIIGGDTVSFDAGAGDRPNCGSLSIDPGGVLTFRMDGREHRLMIGGPLESYGAIRIDATRDPGSRAALALSSEQAENRVIRLFRGSSLLLYGAKIRAEGTPNIEISAGSGGKIEASGDVMLDLHNVRISGVRLRVADVDNTGYKPLQRLNLVNNRFEDGSQVVLERCDTAVIRGSRFLNTGKALLNFPAVLLNGCSLTACGDNTIRGYSHGILARSDIDASVQGNVVHGARTGIVFAGGRNAMIKNNRLEDCKTGLNLDSSSGVVESLRLENCEKGIVLKRVTSQLTDVVVGSASENSVPLTLNGATAVLLNCNIPSDSIKIEGGKPHGEFWARSMNYLVVRVTGKAPDRAVVNVQTAKVSGGVPKKGADLNVRNVPARLSDKGFTPFPRTLRPIVLRSWEIDASGKRRDPPFYDLTVVPVVEAADKAPKVLFQKVIEPGDEWFRDDPDAPEPTLEVKIP